MRTRTLAASLAALALSSAGCSGADEPDPTWDAWSVDHVRTLSVTDVQHPGDSQIRVKGTLDDATGLETAVSEVCGYEEASRYDVSYRIQIVGAGFQVGGCDKRTSEALLGLFTALSSIEHADGVAIIGADSVTVTTSPRHVPSVVRDVITATADRPPGQATVRARPLEVVWTPREADDLEEGLHVLMRLHRLAADDLVVAWLDNLDVTAEVRGSRRERADLLERLDYSHEVVLRAPDDR